jgi:tRNA(fMet)-specific endonuclease VapC
MEILLDADVIIRGEKGVLDLPVWFASRPDDEFHVASITVAELWHGVERATGKRRTVREQYLQTILRHIPVVAYTEQIAYVHARVWAELELAGKKIGSYDLIVSATALERGFHLATFNQRHFSRVNGLSIIVPT